VPRRGSPGDTRIAAVWPVIAATLALAVAAGCGPDVGSVFRGRVAHTIDVRVGEGERFSLAVFDSPGVGDKWTLKAKPDTTVTPFVREIYEADGDEPGANGVRYYVFDAAARGTTTAVLFNCYRCQGGAPRTQESKDYSGAARFRITVR
jgi:inhibitor of cysteine peptidase